MMIKALAGPVKQAEASLLGKMDQCETVAVIHQIPQFRFRVFIFSLINLIVLV